MKFVAVAAILSAGALAAPWSHSPSHSPSFMIPTTHAVPTTHAIVRPTRTSPPKIHASESGGFWHHHAGPDHPHWPAGWQPSRGHAHSSGVAMPTGTGGLPVVPWTAEHLDSAASPTKRRHIPEGHGLYSAHHAWTFVSKSATYTHRHGPFVTTGTGRLPVVPSTALHPRPTTTSSASHGHAGAKRDGRMPFEPRQAEDEVTQVYKVYEI